MKRWLAAAIGLGLVAALGGLLFAWSGLYNVAASTGHLPVTAWFLHFGMENSVETHAAEGAPPDASPAAVERSAAHFETGCAPCHGSPSKAGDLILAGMVPPPPNLDSKIGKWEPGELFWIVKNGIKYAGMPAWPTLERDDEVWAMTAFLLSLPDMSAQSYDALATAAPDSGAQLSALSGSATREPPSLASCARCHGVDGAGRDSAAFPQLTGQSEAYLRRALAEYSAGLRPSGIMQPVAAALDEPELAALASHYASIAGRLRSASQDAPANQIELGRRIATTSAASSKVAPCAACHGLEAGPSNPQYPALAGQHPAYIADQLRLFRDGKRGRTAHAAIMSAAIAGITDLEIEAVAHFYGALAPRAR